MKAKIFTGALSLLFLFSCTNEESTLDIADHAWELQDQWDLEQAVFDPRAMWMDAGEQMVFYDSDDEAPVKIFRDNRIVHKIAAGQGPGEAAGTWNKFFTESEDRRYLFDRNSNRLMEYDNKFNYLRDISADFLYKKLYVAGIYSDSLIFASSNDYIFEIAALDQANSEIRFSLQATDHDFLDPLRNFLLLQTFFFETSEDAFYAAMKNSSVIFRIDNDLNLNYTFGPDSIGIPVNDNRDNFYSLPRIGAQREGLRDLSVHGDFLYALLNGKIYGKFIQMRYENNFDDLIEILRHGEILLIYNRHTLEFIEALRLPIPSLKIEVTDDKIFLLNSLNGDFPFVNIYENNLMK